MTNSIDVVVEPSVEPISLDEAKLYLKIDGDDEDALIAGMISAARRGVEQYLNRSLITQTLSLTIDLPVSPARAHESDGYFEAPINYAIGEMPRVIKLYREPVQLINSVTTYNTQNVSSVYSADNYYLSSGRMALNESASWATDFRRLGGLVINYDAGYGDSGSDVPSGIIHGIYMYLQHMYDERMICDMPDLCMNLLKPYRIYAGS